MKESSPDKLTYEQMEKIAKEVIANNKPKTKIVLWTWEAGMKEFDKAVQEYVRNDKTRSS